MSKRLFGKAAIVTGAASGMGEAIARLFVQQGAQVMMTDLNETDGVRIAQEIGAMFFRQDVTDEQGWQAVVEATVQAFGKLDILVNNAGILLKGDIEQTSYEDWKRLMTVNADSVFLGCKAAIAVMKKQGGSIVNMSSIAALAAKEDYVGYGASKAAIAALTRGVAADCRLKRYRIRCNSVHPDGVLTPMTRGGYPEGIDPELLTIDKDPMNRACRPEDVANGVLYLASDEARAVNGIELRIDSGQFVMSI
ncbi:SDR family oxidoreductase [Denitrificimonas sp. JX-1]|uniref:SDR family oxidoreductase n=1 Tax=Denitrificimonas halotolerans TaxID=3098930 RepID=A0ABU5GMY8_9GAMM|nr:glucose 1-dehydrogenase [Denitrificimonas sp. JX-1]MDY7218059.1 SDR family oxidoreductase [Denitrificimonas sp. JX-1]